jgi:hypothetical protein
VVTLLYKDHAIIAGAKRDELTGKYKPLVHIGWRGSDGKRGGHSFALAQRCSTFEESSALACEAAKSWVDRRLTEGSVREICERASQKSAARVK